MSFLFCDPSVFAIEDRYEILVNTLENGQCAIRIGNETFYDEKAGILISETRTHKIAVPKALLETEGGYTVIYRKTIIKKSYYSKFEDAKEAFFPFKACKKTENINIYHVADVHCRFEEALATASYFGDDLDILVVNGDIAEVNREESFFEVAKFVGDLTKGSIPVVFARGNHDTRGKLASRYSEFYPTENENTYFTTTLGNLAFVVLDCGEDKWDSQEEYGGTNRFEPFRRRETAFLQKLAGFDDKTVIAVSHICPVRTVHIPNPLFEIEKDVYTAWNTELERLGVRFMLTGHIHIAELIAPNGGNLAHNYPLVVGSEFTPEYFLGAAVTVNKNHAEVMFTDKEHAVTFRDTIQFS